MQASGEVREPLDTNAQAVWHVNANQVGKLSDCGHYFVKDTVGEMKQTHYGQLSGTSDPAGGGVGEVGRQIGISKL